MSVGSLPFVTDDEWEEIYRLTHRLERRVEDENPCYLDELYKVIQRPHTVDKLMQLRMYDKYLRPDIDQHVIELTFDYLRSQGVEDPSAAISQEQMDAIQALVDSLDGYIETLAPNAKDPYLGYLLSNFGQADIMTAILNDRGYLPLDTLRALVTEATVHPVPLIAGVL